MDEAERVQRFEAAYNRIDHALTDITAGNGGNRRKHGFAAKVRLAANRRRRLVKYVDFLLEIGELRNAIVHNRTGNDEYLAVPSKRTVLELERIEQLAFSPEKVLPRFARSVVTLHADQSLIDAWRLLQDDGYSRYPVYEGRDGGTFVGLLTSNGFARWVAANVRGTKLEIDMEHVRVADVLAHDHRRNAVAFVSRDVFIDDVDQMFRDLKPLDAVIITADGKPGQKPLGMICAPDIAAMSR